MVPAGRRQPSAGGARNRAVRPPVILDHDHTEVSVEVGTTVVLALGDPEAGRYVAHSSDPSVVRVIGSGGSRGTWTANAAVTAVAPGTATVSVRLEDAAVGRHGLSSALPAFVIVVIEAGQRGAPDGELEERMPGQRPR